MSRRLGSGAKNLTASIFTPFDPASLAGLVAWFRGDSLIDAGGGTASAWNDKSGNGNNAAQAVALAQPTIHVSGLGAKPAATFGGSQFMSGTIGAGLDSLTIWTVVNPVAPQVGRADMFGFGNYRQVFGFISAQLESYNNVDLLFTSVAAAATPYFTEHTIDKTNNHWQAFLNGVPSVANPIVSAVATTATGFAIGAGDLALSGAWAGDISDIILIDHVASPAEEASVHSYFQSYYGLP